MKKVYKKFADGFSLWFKKVLGKRYARNCYTSIDELPIFLWNKIHEERNLLFLIRSQNVYLHKKRPSAIKQYALTLVWEKIYDQYIAKFGFSQEYLDVLRKKKRIANLQVQRIVTGDRSMDTLIEVHAVELEMLNKMNASGDFWELKGYIEKGMGIKIDPMHVSVSEFYSYIKILEKPKQQSV